MALGSYSCSYTEEIVNKKIILKIMSYEERLLIPLVSTPEDVGIEFFTLLEAPVAKGYVRVVIGKRGPYVEFAQDQILFDNFYKADPKEPGKFHWYYDEYRSKDKMCIKLYLQKRTVDYADYKVGMCYIDPFVLTTKKYPILLLSKIREKKKPREEPQINFD